MAINEGGKVRFVGSEWTGMDMDNPPEFASWQEFNALATKAFTVMMRRKWLPMPMCDGKNWSVLSYDEDLPWMNDDWTLKDLSMKFADPFTALVEAEKWYKENVDGEVKQGMLGHEQSNSAG